MHKYVQIGQLYLIFILQTVLFEVELINTDKYYQNILTLNNLLFGRKLSHSSNTISTVVRTVDYF